MKFAASIVVVMLAAAGCTESSSTSDCSSDNAGHVPATPADPPLECPVLIPPDPFASERDACAFGAGAHADTTLGLPAGVAARLPIRHVIVVMNENRSFDHLFGRLHGQGQPNVEAVPASFQNPDEDGRPVAPFHAETTCIHHNPGHQWGAMHAGVNGGAMDGFVKSAEGSTLSDGHFVMSHYEDTDLPFHYWLANHFAMSDRHFASVRSGTYPNRAFLYLGTNDGVRSTGLFHPSDSLPSIFKALDAAGFTWGAYSDDAVFAGAMGWGHDHEGAYCMADFYARLDSGTLPNVAFVDARINIEGDHPPADVQVGEAWVRNIYQHVIKSPQWPRLAMIFAYDEGGGFADHVPPPQTACVARPGEKEDTEFVELGVRVPLIAISPYARPHFVSHVVREHTAITRFIESLFDLPALTARDANSPGLLDLFDFSCDPALLDPPPAPEAGVGGCR